MKLNKINRTLFNLVNPFAITRLLIRKFQTLADISMFLRFFKVQSFHVSVVLQLSIKFLPIR